MNLMLVLVEHAETKKKRALKKEFFLIEIFKVNGSLNPKDLKFGVF